MDAHFHNFADHPGVFIREELEERGWSQSDLAYILGVPLPAVNQIISGKRGINADMAKALGEAFGTSAELFANLQKSFDLSRARSPDPEVSKRGRVQSQYPLRAMIKRGWLIDTPDRVEERIVSFFKVGSLDKVPHLAHAAKKSSRYDNTPPAQLAWLFRVRQIANTIAAPPYAAKKLETSMQQLKHCRRVPEELRHVPGILNDCGIRLIFVEGLPSGKIDGVCFWLDKRSPVIGLSLRLDRIDNFWFVLSHEIAHVLHRHGRQAEIIDVEIDRFSSHETEEERIANKDAADFCIPQDAMESFFHRTKPYFYEKDVLAFAQHMDVHPGLVVGQIQRRSKQWNFLRRHQVKIRDKILPHAMSDGWGNIFPVDL